ncbi:hypothetical protein TMatcc_002308 [Talaromyces marneffei ATCC 18224]|uniref:Uncharacterized protein C18orf19 like B n=1 Tax=Talaromyces marneffei PM1 TaxID=1077442 RepID=A0A093V318_TALMA|nr:uncharacterized protein EYB26_006532 [Talaromyces marneffei]QGA18847.1 hypothetical protein EYB26_006532 [Talaromyces marneffei]
MAARPKTSERLLKFLGFLNRDVPASDQIELGELEGLLQGIDISDDEANNLELLLKRIQDEAGSEPPEWISQNVKIYLDLVEVMDIDLAGRKDLIGHHVVLATAMVKLANIMHGIKPRSFLVSLGSTREQTRQLAEAGPERVKLLSDEIAAELQVLLETAKEEKNNKSKAGEETVASGKELAQRRLNSLKKAKDYSEQLVKIQDSYNKVQTQADKEILAIFKFVLKAVSAIITAIVVIYGWFFRMQPGESGPNPMEPQPSG